MTDVRFDTQAVTQELHEVVNHGAHPARLAPYVDRLPLLRELACRIRFANASEIAYDDPIVHRPAQEWARLIKDAIAQATGLQDETVRSGLIALYGAFRHSAKSSGRRQEAAYLLMGPGVSGETFLRKHENKYHLDVATTLISLAVPVTPVSRADELAQTERSGHPRRVNLLDIRQSVNWYELFREYQKLTAITDKLAECKVIFSRCAAGVRVENCDKAKCFYYQCSDLVLDQQLFYTIVFSCQYDEFRRHGYSFLLPIPEYEYILATECQTLANFETMFDTNPSELKLLVAESGLTQFDSFRPLLFQRPNLRSKWHNLYEGDQDPDPHQHCRAKRISAVIAGAFAADPRSQLAETCKPCQHETADNPAYLKTLSVEEVWEINYEKAWEQSEDSFETWWLDKRSAR